MTFHFEPMDRANARQVLTWCYEPPYDIYNEDPDRVEHVLRALLNPRYAYYTMTDEAGDMVAYCCFGPDARVPGGDYGPQALDVGLGVRPDLTGQGRGHTFVEAVLEFGRRTFAPSFFRVTVAKFNKRALRVWQRAGFRPVQTFGRSSDDLTFVILTRKAKANPAESG